MSESCECKNCALYKTWRAKEEEKSKTYQKALEIADERFVELMNKLERGACDHCCKNRFRWRDARDGAKYDQKRLMELREKNAEMEKQLQDLPVPCRPLESHDSF